MYNAIYKGPMVAMKEVNLVLNWNVIYKLGYNTFN